jgi:MOSC domain-containing protein YiiM
MMKNSGKGRFRAMSTATEVKGRVKTVSVSRKKGVKKTNVEQVRMMVNYGIERDAHAGKWHRQVSMLAMESISKIRNKGIEVNPGDFAENITTEGIELCCLPVGTRMKLGETILVEVTQIGKECHNRCAIFHAVGDCVMPREGIFVRVLRGGVVRPGDAIIVLKENVDP